MTSSIGPLGLLGLILIFLRVAEVIDWPWWIVTAPLWIGPAFAMVSVLVLLLTTAAVFLLMFVCDWRNK